jgi:hypothetical protein
MSLAEFYILKAVSLTFMITANRISRSYIKSGTNIGGWSMSEKKELEKTVREIYRKI